MIWNWDKRLNLLFKGKVRALLILLHWGCTLIQLVTSHQSINQKTYNGDTSYPIVQYHHIKHSIKGKQEMIIRHSNGDINQSVQHEQTHDSNNGQFQNLRWSSLLRLPTASYTWPMLSLMIASIFQYLLSLGAWTHCKYSGLQNRCNVWPFLTELNVVPNRVGIALRIGWVE